MELETLVIIIAAIGIAVGSFSLGFSVRGLLTPSKRNDGHDQSDNADDNRSK